MSIERDLQRIAESNEAIATTLNALCEKINHIGQAVDEVQAEAPTPPKSESAPTADVPPASASTPAPATTATAATTEAPPAPAEVPPAPAAPAETMTPEELNAALVVEFQRLGGREPIDKAMGEFGVTSINQLQPDQYQELLDAVRAV